MLFQRRSVLEFAPVELGTLEQVYDDAIQMNLAIAICHDYTISARKMKIKDLRNKLCENRHEKKK